MAGVLQHLRSSTLDKRPNPASMVDGQVAINYASGSPGMFFKDSNGDLVKVGPVHVGATAPNVSPASGGTVGNSIGEQWLDTSGGTYVFKIWDGAAWRSEAGEFVNAAGDTMTGSLTMGQSANIIFEGSVDDGFETTLTVANPTADRTITLPNVTGTVVTTGDSGSVTSTMIANDTIVDADVNASAAIAGTKISPNFGSQTVQTTGVFSAAGGSAAAPSIAFTGDTNTGIYSPGADQLALSTNGTGRLFVDASGRVGIGASTLSSTLQIAAASPTVRLDDTDLTNNYGLYSHNNGITTLYSRSNTSNGSYYFQGFNGTTATDFLRLNPTSTIFYASGSEAARITSAGLVGIGTSSPSQLLEVNGQVLANNFRVPDAGALISGSRTINGAAVGIYDTAQSVRITTAGTERVRVTSAGSVGIGTASPSSLLHLASSDPRINIEDTDAGGIFQIRNTSGAGYIGTLGAHPLIFNSNASEAARFDTSGRLLVGTSSDSGGALLQVNGDRIRVATAKTPASASDTGTAGEICWDASYIYVCTATNTWKRAALSTW